MYHATLKKTLPYNTDYFSFIGSKYLLVHIKDKATEQFKTALFSVATGAEFTDIDSDPAIRQLFVKNSRSYLYPSKRKYQKIRPPRVRIIDPYGTTDTNLASQKVTFSIQTSNRLPITDLIIANNGRRISKPPTTIGTSRKDGFVTTKYAFECQLEASENTISIRSKHAAAFSNTAEVTVNSIRSVEPSMEQPNLYVLAIGISKYKESKYKLGYADKDADDFVKAWKAQEGLMYGKVVTKVVVNEEATVNGIEDAFEWLKGQPITDRDFAFVFLAGHAMFDPNDIWVFGSTNMSDRNLRRTGITNTRMDDLIEKELKANTVILFLDTCHAGGGTEGSKGSIHHKHGKDVWLDSQKLVFASCTQKESSMESPLWKNGAFTSAIIQAMSCDKCDIDGNGFVSFQELTLKARQFVLAKTGKRQTPTATGNSLNRGVTELIKRP